MMEMTNTLHSGMCRCCASEGTFKDIKTKYHWMGEEEVYADMLSDCFDIKICTPEDFDNGICEVCITQLRNAANFKKQVLHTEEQFKRRLQLKDVKNPIKLESVDDPIESDHLSDADFSGTEYEVPIKEEVDEKPKPKKRAAKATTSRAKKPKIEPESSKKRIMVRVVKRERNPYCGKKESKKTTSAKVAEDWEPKEVFKHRTNIRMILECSNATPIRCHGALGYQCCFCAERFQNPADLKKHTLDHDSKTKRFFMERKILHAYFVKLDITGLRCNICDSDIELLEVLIKHLIESHGKKLYTDIKSHILPFQFNEEILRCIYCFNTFNAFKVLQEHMNIHFRNYICKTCDSGFVTLGMLSNHSKIHLTGIFKCTSCPKVFDTAVKRSSHIKCVHREVKFNKCIYCPERFRDHQTKVVHMRDKHDYQFGITECEPCGKKYNSPRSLRNHIRRDHLQARPNQCQHCDMSFFTKTQLRQHVVKHSGVKNFECEVCSKTYGLKKTLVEHMRIHTNDRRFKCNLCGMAFVQNCSLKGHIRSKHPETLR